MFAELILAAAPVLSPSEVTVVAVSQPAGGTVHLRAVLYSGSADDPPSKEGLAALTALAMAGSPGMGARPVSVSVGKDLIIFAMDPPAEGLEASYARLIRILTDPVFDAAGVDALREAQKQPLESLRADPEPLARAALDSFAYGGHPYGHPPAGLTSALDRIGVEDLKAFYREHCRKGNLAVGLAGDLPAGLEARTREDLERIPEGKPARAPRPYSLLANPRILIVELPSAERIQIGLGHPISVVRAHPDRASLALALGSIGGQLQDASPRRQEIFSLWRSGSPSEGGALLRDALADLARLEQVPSGDVAPSGEAGSPRQPLLPEASTALAALTATLEDILYGTAGARDLVEAAARVASADSIRSAAARHIHSGRLAIVAVVPDAPAFKQQLMAQAAGSDRAEGKRWTEESVDTVKASDLFR